MAVMFVILNSWTKIQSVTFQMKTLGEYILVMESVCNFEPVDENPKCDISNESRS